MSSKAALLSVRRVSKQFGGLRAVNAVSFEVARHELVGLIGPNGSGKTTMLNLISGLSKPTAGQISMQRRPLLRMPAELIARAGVGRTFQLVRLLPGLSVLENVLAGAVFGHKRRWGREAEDFADEVLERVGLQDKIDLPISALTYIDQKRVELARTLAGEPKILLLDEWLAGLNPSELIEGIDLIHRLREEGRTIILVEHVMDAIRSLCDRCVVLNSGAKIADGDPEAVLSDPHVVSAYLGDQAHA